MQRGVQPRKLHYRLTYTSTISTSHTRRIIMFLLDVINPVGVAAKVAIPIIAVAAVALVVILILKRK